jgi:bifunctional non-homologous end joining protein LigD
MPRALPRGLPVRTLSRLPGATRAPYRGFIAPCLATLRPEPPRGDGWFYEIK